jgi:hypothetical protein
MATLEAHTRAQAVMLVSASVQRVVEILTRTHSDMTTHYSKLTRCRTYMLLLSAQPTLKLSRSKATY